MKGDGNFHWYYGAGQFPQEWFGPFARRDDAVAAALIAGLHDGYSLVNADSAALEADIFEPRVLFDHFMELNRSIIDKSTLKTAPSNVQLMDLKSLLISSFNMWLTRNKLKPKVSEFANERHHEYVRKLRKAL